MPRDPRQDPQPGDVLRDRVSRIEVFMVDDLQAGFWRSDRERRWQAWTSLDAWRVWMRAAEVLDVAV
jgi:hypothetical protein